MEKLLMHDFEGLTDEQVVEKIVFEFQVERSEVEKYDILIGFINDFAYESDAYFLLRDRETGSLFEVRGGHCSCNGYEDQWDPKITSKEYLLSPQYYWREDEKIMQFVKGLFN